MGNINDVLKGMKGKTSYYNSLVSCPHLLLPILPCHSLPVASLHPAKKYFGFTTIAKCSVLLSNYNKDQ